MPPLIWYTSVSASTCRKYVHSHLIINATQLAHLYLSVYCGGLTLAAKHMTDSPLLRFCPPPLSTEPKTCLWSK